MKFKLFIIVAALLVSIIACDEDKNKDSDTPSETLTKNSPWSPVSIIIDGTESFDPCLADNTWDFQSGGLLVTKEGSNICFGGSDQDGSWSVNEAGTEFTFDVVGQFTADISILTASTFEYSYSQTFGGTTYITVFKFEN